jgi:DNA mismatch repair protein MSH6
MCVFVICFACAFTEVVLQSFRKLNKGLHALAEKASYFETQAISGLLRQAEDLSPYLQNVKQMFVPLHGDSVDLVPEKGMDEEYDAITGEIDGIETELESGLRKLAKKHE